MKELKQYLLKKTRNTLVELYLQKCIESEREKAELQAQIDKLKNDRNFAIDCWTKELLRNNQSVNQSK